MWYILARMQHSSQHFYSDTILLVWTVKFRTRRYPATIDFSQPKEVEYIKGIEQDHIHTINQVIQKWVDYTQPLYVDFIDCEKTFDSLETSAVMQALQIQSAEEQQARIQNDSYNGSEDVIDLH